MRKALVIDDEPGIRRALRALLGSNGWEVAEAWDGSDGLEQIRLWSPDLLILDVQMPRMSGFDLFAELAKNPETESLKVIVLTGLAEKIDMRFSPEEMGEFFGRKPDAYVEKPFDAGPFLSLANSLVPPD